MTEFIKCFFCKNRIPYAGKVDDSVEKLKKEYNEFCEDQIKTPKLKVGWVYKDGEGNEILIISSNPRLFYGVVGFWLSSYWCKFSTYTQEGNLCGDSEFESSETLIHSTGKKWEPEE